MNSTTSKTRETVRMFDGIEFATYKVGGKKHRAAEARRAEFDAAKAARKERNNAFAVVLRENDVTPKGAAWAAVTSWADEGGHGETNLRFCLEAEPEFVEKLRGLNAEEGIKRPSEIAAAKKPAAKKGKKGKAAKVTAEPTEPVKKVGKKARRKARSEASKRGWDTRRANEAARLAAEKAERKAAKKGKGKKASKAGKVMIATDLFVDAGFSAKDIARLESLLKARA